MKLSEHELIDLLVIGGGVNGAGIARDAAGRGLRVVLCEKDDIAQGTSSRSGKLIHGGLRYLEYYEFRLVREALIEREVLLRAAPHIVWPLRFVIPHTPDQRPAWLVRLGLFLYDHLGGREKLPGSRSLDLARDPEGAALKPEYRKAFEYSDCWVDDARLVLLNVLDAKEKGATVLTRTAATSARRVNGLWDVELTSSDGTKHDYRAKAIANAAGPWVERVIKDVVGAKPSRKVRLVKGSHVIVKKFWNTPNSYVFQNHDKRLVFLNSYQGKFGLIGTTDIPFKDAPETVAITEDETDYMLAAVNKFTRAQLTRADVLENYSGVRPLYDDDASNPSAVTRDYVFDVEGVPPLLSVFGGKITTYRKLAEHALQKLKPHLPHMGKDWTARGILPGGDIADADFEVFLAGFQKAHDFLPKDVATHYCRLYGSRAPKVLNGATKLRDLGQHFGGLLYEAEIAYLKSNEWALTADDVLIRRTKHGLHLSNTEKQAVVNYMGM